MTAARTTPGNAAEAEADLTGIDRRADYEYWTDGAALGGVLVHARGRLVAAGALSQTAVVHVVCPEDAYAAAAVTAAAAQFEGGTVGICLPGPHPAVRSLVISGYCIEDYDIFMATSADLLPATMALSPALA